MRPNERGLVCLEIYADTLCNELVAAIDVPRKYLQNGIREFGRALCRFRSLGAVEVLILDELGNQVDRKTVYKA